MTDDLGVVPASEASREDLAAVFGTSDYPAMCLCQRFKGHVGARQVFEDGGFTEVSHPTLRRVVMRIDFD